MLAHYLTLTLRNRKMRNRVVNTRKQAGGGYVEYLPMWVSGTCRHRRWEENWNVAIEGRMALQREFCLYQKYEPAVGVPAGPIRWPPVSQRKASPCWSRRLEASVWLNPDSERSWDKDTLQFLFWLLEETEDPSCALWFIKPKTAEWIYCNYSIVRLWLTCLEWICHLNAVRKWWGWVGIFGVLYPAVSNMQSCVMSILLPQLPTWGSWRGGNRPQQWCTGRQRRDPSLLEVIWNTCNPTFF
jgi:hypothetical protein